MFLKNYIFSLKKFILISFLVFIFSFFIGYFFAQNSPEEMMAIFEQIKEAFSPVANMTAFNQFTFVFLNNSITAFLAIFFGIIFGIFPLLVLFSNGIILGIVIYFSQTGMDWSTIFILIFPHGIIEIPAVIIACAAGLKLGKIFIKMIFQKRFLSGFRQEIGKELKVALIFFLKILLPFLAIAAAIEIFFTVKLL